MRPQLDVVIVDDEPLARQRLERLLADEPQYQVVGSAANASEAIALCTQRQPDIVLLDVQMPDGSGVDVARRLAALDPQPAIVFVTAFDEHALSAFDAGGQAYLLKPVEKEKLLETLERVCRPTRAQLPKAPTARTHISVTWRGELHCIPVEDIYYFRAEQKYVLIRHSQGEILTEEPLKSLEEEFAERFVRIHRNALVAVREIGALRKNDVGASEVYLPAIDESLTVSRRHLPEVRKRLRAGKS